MLFGKLLPLLCCHSAPVLLCMSKLLASQITSTFCSKMPLPAVWAQASRPHNSRGGAAMSQAGAQSSAW